MAGMLRSPKSTKGAWIPDRAKGRGGGKSHRRYKHETEYVKRALAKADRNKGKRECRMEAE
jgi:hypothetical protein